MQNVAVPLALAILAGIAMAIQTPFNAILDRLAGSQRLFLARNICRCRALSLLFHNRERGMPCVLPISSPRLRSRPCH